MATLWVMCGVSGSGKSTIARKMQTLNEALISTDSIRKELYGDESIQGDGAVVFHIAYERIEAALCEGKDVIFDAMNITRRGRRQLIKCFKEKAELCCVCIEVTEDIALARQKLRERQVPDDIVRAQLKRFVKPDLSEGWDMVTFV